MVVCITPLVSVMMDQKNKFSPKGIRTQFVGEAQIDQTNVIRGSYGVQ